MSYINIFGGTPIQSVVVSYSSITLSASKILSWPTQFQDTNNVVTDIIDVTPQSGGLTITLPDATQTSVGERIIINNLSGSTAFNILDNAGGLLSIIGAGNIFFLYLYNNTTVAGSWRTIAFGLGTPVVTSVAAASLTAGLTITGSPITTAGTLNFSLANDLANIASLATTGIAVRTANTGTWANVSLVGGSNVTITNASGVTGNPTIALNSTVTGLTSLTVGNLNLTSNILSSTSGNMNVLITPNGTGSVVLGSNATPVTITSAGNLSTSGNISGATITASTALVTSFSPSPIARVFASFDGATATLNTTFNVASMVRNSVGNYTFNFSSALATANYIALATGVSTTGLPSAMVFSKTTTSVGVLLVNASSGTAEDQPGSFCIFY
jgi:hypothetical protein